MIDVGGLLDDIFHGIHLGSNTCSTPIPMPSPTPSSTIDPVCPKSLGLMS
jgi:hypothetical protein